MKNYSVIKRNELLIAHDIDEFKKQVYWKEPDIHTPNKNPDYLILFTYAFRRGKINL